MSRLLLNFGYVFKTATPSIGDILEKLGVDQLEDLLSVMQTVIAALLGVFGELILLFTDGINKPIKIPVLSALYKKISDNEMTILDVVALLIAIPSTIRFKVVNGKRPKELDGISELLKPNEHRAELDTRMGWVRSEGSSAATFMATGGPAPNFSMHSLQAPTFSMNSMQASTFNAKTAHSNGTPPKPKPPALTVSNQKRKDAEYNSKRFIASSSIPRKYHQVGLSLWRVSFLRFLDLAAHFQTENRIQRKECLCQLCRQAHLLALWLCVHCQDKPAED